MSSQPSERETSDVLPRRCTGGELLPGTLVSTKFYLSPLLGIMAVIAAHNLYDQIIHVHKKRLEFSRGLRQASYELDPRFARIVISY